MVASEDKFIAGSGIGAASCCLCGNSHAAVRIILFIIRLKIDVQIVFLYIIEHGLWMCILMLCFISGRKSEILVGINIRNCEVTVDCIWGVSPSYKVFHSHLHFFHTEDIDG